MSLVLLMAVLGLIHSLHSHSSFKAFISLVWTGSSDLIRPSRIVIPARMGSQDPMPAKMD